MIIVVTGAESDPDRFDCALEADALETAFADWADCEVALVAPDADALDNALEAA